MLKGLKKLFGTVLVAGLITTGGFSVSEAYMVPADATLNDFTVYTTQQQFIDYTNASYSGGMYISADNRTAYIPNVGIVSHYSLPRTAFGQLNTNPKSVSEYYYKSNGYSSDYDTAMSHYGYSYNIKHSEPAIGNYVVTVWPILGGGEFQVLTLYSASSIVLAAMVTPRNDVDLYNVYMNYHIADRSY